MRIILVCTLLLIPASSSISFAEDCFPQKATSYSSEKNYKIFWREPNDGETHHLIFDDGKTQQSFFDFGRSACIIWSPNEKYFSLTYHRESNISEAYIYQTEGPQKLLEIADIIPERVKKLYTQNHHRYIEAQTWTSEGLFVQAWGYGDLNRDGLEAKMRCTVVHAKTYCVEIIDKP